ncbi:serine--tRNA ligase [Candidatus Kuenenbacteria bacterium]|nr:serine--tRNA ligase [Candidatus Kuenenbacteria bacterium]
MLDIKFIRENSDLIKKTCENKRVNVDIDGLLELDKKRKKFIQKIDELRTQRNKIAEKIKKDFSKKDKLIQEGKNVKEEILKLENESEETEKKFNQLMYLIPNPPLPDVKIGRGEEDNEILRHEGEIHKFNFEPQSYVELAEKLDLIDIKRAAKVSGSRFGYLKNEVALLEFALIQFTFQNLIKENFIPIIPPIMIKRHSMEAMGYLTRGEEEIYYLPKDELYLVGTSEQSIGPMHCDEIFEEKNLPKRYLGFSSCFRREAGSYGKDTKGILRVHQFDKLEMFSFCKPENSEKEHDFFLLMEEKLVQLLKIPYRVIKMCTGDLGDPAAKKFDLEAWLPGQNEFREITSTSNCTDFQARRLNIRYRNKNGKLNFVHTLNGTAFAIGRIIIAILENYQQADGSIKIPKVLQPYMGGREIINA